MAAMTDVSSSAARPGLLALVGGDEFKPGNEAQDRQLVEAALRHGGAAYIVATAAREHPDAAVATARGWFSGLGLEVSELRLRTRTEAGRAATVAAAEGASFVYLAGGDPGRVPQILADTPAWEAVLRAWRAGAVLAGSSAGAMALGSWTLIRARVPGDTSRTARAGLGVVPGIAVVPHFETFGHRWLPSIRDLAASEGVVLLGISERSAAMWDDGTWRVEGPGAVTVIDAEGEWRHGAGEPIDGLPAPRVAGNVAG
jgi:cyanophycinase